MRPGAWDGPIEVVVRVGRSGPSLPGGPVQPDELFEARVVQGHREAYVMARAPSERWAVRRVIALLQRKGLHGTARLVRKWG